MEGIKIRLAKHAGSWYTAKKESLDFQLQGYLSKVEIAIKAANHLKAVIAPHAGYTYSGPTAAWAYKYLQLQNQKKEISKIFLLGPSHKKYFEGCSLSGVDQLQTPYGNLKVDTQMIKQLKTKGAFVNLTKKDEQNQHSLEMHLPYIFKIFENKAKIIPIIVGNINPKNAEEYGQFFAPYFDRQDTIFIVSSDFCHWGDHFDYQPVDKKGVPIWQHIEKIDKQGIQLIEKTDIDGFNSYLKQTQNTICGREPIKILMNTIKHSKCALKTSSIKYDQSSKVVDMDDSSVSYASLISYTPKQ